MALTRSGLSLISLALVGGLAFTACGSSSNQDAGASASASDSASTSSSASASGSASDASSVELTAETVTDEAKQKLPDFVTSYFDTMRGGAQQQLSENTQKLLNDKIQGDSGSSTADVIASIDKNLSDDEKQSIIDDLKSGADPMYKMVDHEGLAPAQDIVLSMFMISQSTTLFQQTATVDESQVKVSVDASKVTYDGSTASVSPYAMTTPLRESAMATATASSSMDEQTEAANTLPLVWTNDGWKLDGKKYFDAQAQ